MHAYIPGYMCMCVTSQFSSVCQAYAHMCMLCLECRVSWIRVPPEAALFLKGKVTALDVLCCFALLFV